MSKDSYIGKCKLLKTDVAKDTADERAIKYLMDDIHHIKISDSTSNADLLQYEDIKNTEMENKSTGSNKK